VLFTTHLNAGLARRPRKCARRQRGCRPHDCRCYIPQGSVRRLSERPGEGRGETVFVFCQHTARGIGNQRIVPIKQDSSHRTRQNPRPARGRKAARWPGWGSIVGGKRGGGTARARRSHFSMLPKLALVRRGRVWRVQIRHRESSSAISKSNSSIALDPTSGHRFFGSTLAGG
jgi:hypothetical protein